MSNYKFNIDPKEPREDQIERHKDFGKVMQNYQRMTNPLYKTPLYRYRKLFLIVFLVLFVAWLVAEFGENENEKKNSPVDSAQQLKKDSVKPIKDSNFNKQNPQLKSGK
ncbi:MAG: hypothetical protein NT084_08060 [Bacteroidetes bacterium]|jgi:hypothetical protein|nr:hypothetical protein [Bacteroidota bacterium]